MGSQSARDFNSISVACYLLHRDDVVSSQCSDFLSVSCASLTCRVLLSAFRIQSLYFKCSMVKGEMEVPQLPANKTHFLHPQTTSKVGVHLNSYKGNFSVDKNQTMYQFFKLKIGVRIVDGFLWWISLVARACVCDACLVCF